MDIFFSLFMAEKYFIVYMYHFFCIHSSVNGHLDCFHFLAILNNASMDLGGEGNGTPLQYSCVENPKDRGAW